MNTKLLTLALCALLGFAGNASAQKDITSQYITNATLANGTTGWTVNNFNAPQRGNNTVGFASEAYAGWDSLEKTSYSMTQNITLPKGSYRLVNYSFFRQGGSYNTNPSKSLAFLKAGNQQVALQTLGSITAGSYADSQVEGANCFDSKMYRNVVEFEISADNTSIEIGLVGTFDEMRSWCIAGMFELFDLNDVASVSSPTDVTYAITNSGFEYRNLTGWTNNGLKYQNNNWANKAGVGFAEQWVGGVGLGSDKSMTQTLSNMPAGLYEISVYGHNIEQYNNDAAGTGMYLTANGEQTPITSYGQYKVRTTLATAGNLTIGIKLDNCTGNWIAFDRFGLMFYGDPLQAYKDLLSETVAAAHELIESGILKTGAAHALQTVVENNDNSNDAFTTESEFNTAIDNINNAITTANEIVVAYAPYEAFKTKILTLKNKIEPCDSKTAFENAVNDADAAVEAATTAEAVNAQIPALRSAGMTFISTTEGSFDITFLASQNYLDWKKKDGSAAGQVTWAITNKPDDIPAFAESYEETCATTGTVLYQTVTDLPEGYYQVGMYAQANYTPGRGFTTEATEGDADRSFAFANELRTGIPISFQSEVPFSALTTLDVNVHLTETGDLTFGVQKDRNGSNWHFAQIAAITYSKEPDLTNLQATRDALVAEAMSLLNGAEASFLTETQKNALQEAIDEGNAANTFETLNTATLTTLPEAINTAKSQIAAVKVNRVEMLEALERFETEYNLADGTDYRRVTMSAEVWTSLIEKVNAASLALDDISMAPDYGTIKDELVSQMNATDVSLRLFKSYKAMVDGTTALELTTETDSQMNTDLSEQNAIESMNAAFVDYARRQSEDFSMNAFLGENLDFNTPQGNKLTTEENWKIYDIAGWEEAYANLDEYCFIENSDTNYENQLYLRSNWTTKTVTLEVMKQKMLPVGKYKLSFNWNSDLNNMVNRSFYRLGDQTVTLGKATNGFETLEYIFEVADAALPFDLAFGLQKQNSGNTPAQILVDDITLTYTRIDDGVCDYFVIQDKEDLTIENAFTATTLENTRTLAQSTDAYTVCLPYSLSSNDDVQFYELSSVSSDGTMHFNEVETTEPLMPYLAVANADASLNAENVELAVTTGDMPSISVNGYTMMGTMTNISREEAINLKAYILQSGNKWRMVNSNSGSNVSIPAFRAYIVADNASTAAPQLSVSFGVATGIKNIQNLDSNNAIYDLQGRKLSPNQVKSGIYIVNGKKVAKHKFVVK